MGGVGSGGYKNSPGDIETHAAWNLIDPIPGVAQKLRQAQCKYCCKQMAQHTSRQRIHLSTCRAYLEAMRSRGIENSITQRALDPPAPAVPRKPDLPDGNAEKRKAIQKIIDFPTAVRIQALALAEASISYDCIREITGMGAKLLDKLRKIARDQGYDPTTSMQIKEEYVMEPGEKVPGKPRKQRDGCPLQNAAGGGVAATGAIPDYAPADAVSLPPGD